MIFWLHDRFRPPYFRNCLFCMDFGDIVCVFIHKQIPKLCACPRFPQSSNIPEILNLSLALQTWNITKTVSPNVHFYTPKIIFSIFRRIFWFSWKSQPFQHTGLWHLDQVDIVILKHAIRKKNNRKIIFLNVERFRWKWYFYFIFFYLFGSNLFIPAISFSASFRPLPPSIRTSRHVQQN